MSISSRSAALASVLLLTGCQDPATQEPVDLAPGLYDIHASGESYIEISQSKVHDTKCLSSSEAKEFPLFPMQLATRKVPDCTDTVEPRTGNLVRGKRFCRATFRGDDKRTSTYVVQIKSESFGIIGNVVDHDDGSGPETGRFRVIANRVGDC